MNQCCQIFLATEKKIVVCVYNSDWQVLNLADGGDTGILILQKLDSDLAYLGVH